MAPTTTPSNGRAGALRLLEELPGIADVVWATVTRLASARVLTRVLFTAPEGRAGTSVLAAATAIGLAQHQRVPVCLLETNVARPALAGYLGLASAGLSDVLDGRAELEDCLREPRGCPGLLVLPAGTPRAPVAGEFTAEPMNAILERLAQRCRYLVLDAAPVLQHVESRQLLRHADAVVLVLRARSTHTSAAERAHDILVESGTPVLGSIFNAYRPEGLFGGGRADRSFRQAVLAERPPVHGPYSARREAASSAVAATPPAPEPVAAPTNGGAHANGDHALETAGPSGAGSDAAHRHQIEILERRIAKLAHLLEQTEADLRRIAALKDVDLGIASVYRGVQGLSPEEGARAFKQSLMREIFQANLELKTAMARRH